MPLKVNLVVIVLIGAVYPARTHEELQICSKSYTGQDSDLDRSLSKEKDILDKEFINIQKASLPRSSESTNGTVRAANVDDLLGEMMQLKILNQVQQIIENEKLQVSARGKYKMDRMLMALLVAYKMKFLALVPTLIGSIVLLLASNTLAGFFFALFAAVVSMKGR